VSERRESLRHQAQLPAVHAAVLHIIVQSAVRLICRRPISRLFQRCASCWPDAESTPTTSWRFFVYEVWLYVIVSFMGTVAWTGILGMHSLELMSVDSHTNAVLCLWRVSYSADTAHCCMQNSDSGFPRPLESPELFFLKIPGPGKSWKSTLVLESPENRRLRSWKVLEKYPWKLRIFYRF